MTSEDLDDPVARMHQPPEVRLGNDVVRALAWMPHDEVVGAVATHLRSFWDPRMRAALRAQVEAGEPDVHPVLAEAIRSLPVEASGAGGQAGADGQAGAGGQAGADGEAGAAGAR